MKEFIVALDGPAGSGKSTIAKRIAKQYHFTYVDTGAMYRMITWFFLENNVSWKEEVACQKALGDWFSGEAGDLSDCAQPAEALPPEYLDC